MTENSTPSDPASGNPSDPVISAKNPANIDGITWAESDGGCVITTRNQNWLVYWHLGFAVIPVVLGCALALCGVPIQNIGLHLIILLTIACLLTLSRAYVLQFGFTRVTTGRDHLLIEERAIIASTQMIPISEIASFDESNRMTPLGWRFVIAVLSANGAPMARIGKNIPVRRLHDLRLILEDLVVAHQKRTRS